MKVWLNSALRELRDTDIKPTPDAVVTAYCAVLWIVCIAAGILP